MADIDIMYGKNPCSLIDCVIRLEPPGVVLVVDHENQPICSVLPQYVGYAVEGAEAEHGLPLVAANYWEHLPDIRVRDNPIIGKRIRKVLTKEAWLAICAVCEHGHYSPPTTAGELMLTSAWAIQVIKDGVLNLGYEVAKSLRILQFELRALGVTPHYKYVEGGQLLRPNSDDPRVPKPYFSATGRMKSVVPQLSLTDGEGEVIE